MNIYLKQKVFSWGDKFSAYNEAGEEVYSVKGQVFSFGKKLHISDVNGQEIAFIHEKVFAWRPKYFIEYGGKTIEVVKNITFLKPKYTVKEMGLTISGDFFAHSYGAINGDNKTAFGVSKKWFTWGDTYQIEVNERFDPVTALCIVLVIDACVAKQHAASAAASSH